jgi:hypothetical protein
LIQGIESHRSYSSISSKSRLSECGQDIILRILSGFSANENCLDVVCFAASRLDIELTVSSFQRSLQGATKCRSPFFRILLGIPRRVTKHLSMSPCRQTHMPSFRLNIAHSLRLGCFGSICFARVTQLQVGSLWPDLPWLFLAPPSLLAPPILLMIHTPVAALRFRILSLAR